MTYDELLEAVKDIPTTLAIVELHKPQEKLSNTCQECDYYGDWPCSTIQAIEGQLK